MQRQVVEFSGLDRNEKRTPVLHKKPRALTHDEQKAAEAAFRFEPFNPAWSQAARSVYNGLMDAMARLQPSPFPLLHAEIESEAIWDQTVVS